jgi:hypothetical protein
MQYEAQAHHIQPTGSLKLDFCLFAGWVAENTV